MHEFVRRFRSNLHAVPLRMNCCLSVKQIEDNVGSTRLTLPGGIEIWIRYPHCMDVCEEPCGEAYLSDYDVWSPELPAEELADWVETQLDCCRRIDEYCEKHSHELHPLNSAMQADLAARIKNVWRMAQAAVDLPKGFRYTGFRSEEDWVKSTLVYTSPKSGAFTWLLKSGLGLEPDGAGAGIDGWAFQPDFRPLSESIHKIRPGYSIDMGTELYVQQISGQDEQARDKKAAYWLVGILNDIVDKAIESPPPRCYPVLLADHVTNLKKSDLDTMTIQGITTLLNAGVLTGEQVLKGKPEMFKKLLQKNLVSGEMVARRLPEQVFWLAKNKYISPDYAIKLQPALKDKLLKAGLYSETDLSGYTPEQILGGVKDGTITPVDAYRANPKLLQSMVENKLITPQEAYKLDAAIVTWLLLNHYIGRAEAKRVKSDIERYVKQKHKDVDWESLDAARNPNPDMIRYEGGQVTSIVKGKITAKNLEKALIAAVKEDPDTPSATLKVGDVEAWVSPSGYEDNRLILDGKFNDAKVEVTLMCDWKPIDAPDGKPWAYMKGSEVLAYLNDAAQKYHSKPDEEEPALTKRERRKKIIDDAIDAAMKQFKTFGSQTDLEVEVPEDVNDDRFWMLFDRGMRELNYSYNVQEKTEYPGGTCYYLHISDLDELDSSRHLNSSWQGVNSDGIVMVSGTQQDVFTYLLKKFSTDKGIGVTQIADIDDSTGEKKQLYSVDGFLDTFYPEAEADYGLDSSLKDKLKQMRESFAKYKKDAAKASDDIDDANAKILAKAKKIREAAGLSSSKAKPKRAPRQLKINSSTSVRAQLADSRVIDGTHYFCVEGPGVGDNIQYMNQLQTYLPGYTVSSSGYNDRLYVAAPEEARDIVNIAVQHFNRDLVSDLNSCDTGATQVSDIAQTTTIPGKKSINSDLTEVNREINEELQAEGQAVLAPLTPVQEATAEGPAWKVTIKYPGDLLSDYTTWILIPAIDKAAAQVKFNEKMGDKASIISWDEQVNSLDEYRKKYPLSNVSVLE